MATPHDFRLADMKAKYDLSCTPRGDFGVSAGYHW